MAKRIIIPTKPDLNQPLSVSQIANYVRYKRASLGMTLEDAASLCGLSKQAYNNVEKGLPNVRIETVFKVLEGLGIKLFINEQQESPAGRNDGWY
ncbi:helix-turn-helix domain-containing protein [Idiomarina seosinensis]|uniref:helix-turn-helix domain-containing protein n=1 Tax=Idiomarina seosinensis TaxID=281739 RepID=UPI00384B4842